MVRQLLHVAGRNRYNDCLAIQGTAGIPVQPDPGAEPIDPRRENLHAETAWLEAAEPFEDGGPPVDED